MSQIPVVNGHACRLSSKTIPLYMHQGVQNSLNSIQPGGFVGATFAAGADGPRRVLRAAFPGGTRVQFGNVEVGGLGFVVIAGPCAVEGADQTEAAASAVGSGGAHALRGGVFKP